MTEDHKKSTNKRVWTECFSKKYQTKYWFNEKDGKSSWIQPAYFNGDDEEGLIPKIPKINNEKMNENDEKSEEFYEDFPVLAVERERQRILCLALFVNENRYACCSINKYTLYVIIVVVYH
jgi:hypothetical protein